MRRYRNRHRVRRAIRHATQMQYGLPRAREPNYLGIACRLLGQYVRWRERTRSDFAAIEREYRQQLERARREQEFEEAFRKVYGAAPAPGAET